MINNKMQVPVCYSNIGHAGSAQLWEYYNGDVRYSRLGNGYSIMSHGENFPCDGFGGCIDFVKKVISFPVELCLPPKKIKEYCERVLRMDFPELKLVKI
jgi:hypothetical protein